MIQLRHFSTVLLLSVSALTGTVSAQTPGTCQPGIAAALQGPHAATYSTLANALGFNAANLTTLLGAVNNQATYQTLLNFANALAGTTPNGRVVLTLPDGTVVIDTARDDGPGSPQNNSFDNFQNKTINENHNSRVAIIAAQEYPCGIAVETKTSTSTGQIENYVAIRLGTHLDSQGTARFSKRQ